MGRILLIEGKQRELIENIKDKFNFTWKELAKKLNCNNHYLYYELRYEKRTLSGDIYKKLCDLLEKDFDEFIKDKLKDNWGQIKGGKSVKNHKNLFQIKKPKILCNKSKELAEIIGIMLGDGSIYILPEKGIYQVRVASNAHLKEEIDYSSIYVKSLFENTFGLKMQIKKTTKCNYVWKQSKDLVFTLNKFGLPTGNKKKNNIKIPDWIMNNKGFMKACLRGIVDTDGYLYPKNKLHTYPTISISSAIPNLQESITKACNMLGLKLSHWRKKKVGADEAYIRTKGDTFKFFKEINFNNPKHRIRFKKFCKAPVV